MKYILVLAIFIGFGMFAYGLVSFDVLMNTQEIFESNLVNATLSLIGAVIGSISFIILISDYSNKKDFNCFHNPYRIIPVGGCKKQCEECKSKENYLSKNLKK